MASGGARALEQSPLWSAGNTPVPPRRPGSPSKNPIRMHSSNSWLKWLLSSRPNAPSVRITNRSKAVSRHGGRDASHRTPKGSPLRASAPGGGVVGRWLLVERSVPIFSFGPRTLDLRPRLSQSLLPPVSCASLSPPLCLFGESGYSCPLPPVSCPLSRSPPDS